MTTEHKHSQLDEAMERANDSWAGRPYPVGPGVSQEFARAVQDRTTLAAEVTRLEEQLEAMRAALDNHHRVGYRLEWGEQCSICATSNIFEGSDHDSQADCGHKVVLGVGNLRREPRGRVWCAACNDLRIGNRAKEIAA